MTHEELIAHKGTVWSSFGGAYEPQEYEYMGEGACSVWGTFRRIATGELLDNIPVSGCFVTERDWTKACLRTIELLQATCGVRIAALRQRLDVLDGKAED